MIDAPALVTRTTRRRMVDPAWPIVAITVGLPVAYLLGLAALLWALPALVFGIALWRSPSVTVPRCALPLLALAGWTLFTIVRLSSPGAAGLFLYRWLLWASTAACFLWLVNPTSRGVSTRRIVDLLAALFIVLVAFGYVAMALPDVAIASPFQTVLAKVAPGAVAPSAFLHDLTIIRFAELQEFATGSVPRPAAPMAYTNGWGSTLGLTAPFFALSWLGSQGRLRRNLGIVVALAAIVPIMVSTNRGLWLSVGIAVVYYALRRAFAGDVRPMLVTVFVTALLVTITLLTPLQQSIANRFSGAEASNTTRERLYDTALAESLRSPLLGYGAPQSTDEGPAIGTHGLMWYVMFSHGFPALALLFLSAAALIVATARVRTPMGVAAHLSIVIFATQIPFYGLFPQIVLVGVAAGIALRETSTHDLELAA